MVESSARNAARDAATAREPLVSVIMNCYNSAKYLREAIESVLAQDYSNWELVFWDNRSTDDSASILHSYADARLKYFLAPEHTTLYGARNLALEVATGEFLCFLDCDDRWLPAKLARQVAVFQAHPETGLLYTNYHLIDRNGARTGTAFSSPQPSGNVFGAFLRRYPVAIQSVMLKRLSVMSMSRRFDPAMELTGDYDFFLRFVSAHGAQYIHEPLLEYRVHPLQASLAMVARWPEELRMTIDSLRADNPDIDVIYSREIDYLGAKLAYRQADAHMHQGLRSRATERLAPVRFRSVVFFILYLVSFLPPRIWIELNQRRRAFGISY